MYTIQAISTHIAIKYCQQDSATGERTYCVEIFNGQKQTDILLNSAILTSQGCKELLKYGCIFDESNSRFLLQYLSNSAYSAPIVNVHSRLGWNFSYDTPVFFTSKAISQNEYESEYVDGLDLTPKGSLEAWLEMVKTEVVGKISLEFCMILGFSSVILGYLNYYMDIGCIIFNLCNNSSRGKTSAAMLSASVFGNPALEKGLAVSMNSTKNAIIGFAAKSSAHTIVFDEAASCDRKFFREVLYQLAIGSDKKRENPDGSMKRQKTFHSCVICTSEFPIIDDSAPNGIRARVFEISDTLTKSAENADNIKKCVYQNYGYAGVKFAEYIIKKLDSILSDYLKAEKILKMLHREQNFPCGELTERVISKLAVILLTADYVKKCFAMEINIRKLAEYLLLLEQSVLSEADIADKALDCIMQYITRHNNRFITDPRTDINFSIEGTIKTFGRCKEITILKPVVEEILSTNGFENPRDIYKKWAEKKILLSEKDRPYKRVKLIKSVPAQACFVFRSEE